MTASFEPSAQTRKVYAKESRMKGDGKLHSTWDSSKGLSLLIEKISVRF